MNLSMVYTYDMALPPPKKYEFDTIFNYSLSNGLIIPRYTVVVNNIRYPKGVAISKATDFKGLNLFNYIGKDIAGQWDGERKELNIVGFY
jgi:hypothetical protein